MNPVHYGAYADESSETPPLFQGSVISRRWFQVSAQGHLKAPYYLAQYQGWSLERLNSHAYTAECERVVRPWAKDYTHRVASAKCSCGFYSFWDRPFVSPGEDVGVRIGAVVECWGRMTVGKKGLRAERMRILALAVPRRDLLAIPRFFRDSTAFMVPMESRIKKIQVNYPGLPIYSSWREAEKHYEFTSYESIEKGR